MKWLTPFAYEDDDRALHLLPERVLQELGLPVTEENLGIAIGEMARCFKEQWPNTPLVITTAPPAKEVHHG